MKTFKIKKGSLGFPREGTSHDLAKYFLEIHDYWFTDRVNSMYGSETRQACYETLIDFMEFDKQPEEILNKEPEEITNLVYCIVKFELEFFNEYEEKCEKDYGTPK